MSVVQQNVSWNCATLSAWTAWLTAMSNALTSLGFSKTTDTGQLVIANQTVVPTLAASYGTNIGSIYEIRQMVSPGLPTIYMRVEYGVTIGPTTSGRPEIRFRFGTATDGAGNLGGVVNPRYIGSADGASSSNQPFASAASSAALRPFFMAGDGANYFTFIIDPAVVVNDMANNGALTIPYSMGAMGMERTITPGDGTYNGAGWVQVDYGSIANTAYAITSITSNNSVFQTTNFPAQTPGSLFSSSGTGNSCTVFPYTSMTPAPQGPPTMAIAYFTNDVLLGTQFQVTMYGAVRNYLAVGQNPFYGKYSNPAGVSTYSAALRFD